MVDYFKYAGLSGVVEQCEEGDEDLDFVCSGDYAALQCKVESLRAGLNQAIELLATALIEPQQITEEEIHELRTLEQLTPTQCMNQIEQRAVSRSAAENASITDQQLRRVCAHAGRLGFIACAVHFQEFMSPLPANASVEDTANRYFDHVINNAVPNCN